MFHCCLQQRIDCATDFNSQQFHQFAANGSAVVQLLITYLCQGMPIFSIDRFFNKCVFISICVCEQSLRTLPTRTAFAISLPLTWQTGIPTADGYFSGASLPVNVTVALSQISCELYGSPVRRWISVFVFVGVILYF
jgi:hypothetical protein